MWSKVYLVVLASFVWNANSAEERIFQYQQNITLGCGHGIADPYAIEWHLANGTRIVRQVITQGPSFDSRYETRAELDFPSGNLTIYMLNFNDDNGYLCGYEAPPGTLNSATNYSLSVKANPITGQTLFTIGDKTPVPTEPFEASEGDEVVCSVLSRPASTVHLEMGDNENVCTEEEVDQWYNSTCKNTIQKSTKIVKCYFEYDGEIFPQDGDTDINIQFPDNGGLGGGAIAGIVIGCVIVVCGTCGVCYFFVVYKKKRSKGNTQ